MQYTDNAPVAAPTGAGGYQAQVAKEFRQWVPLCTSRAPSAPGTYFVQVQTNAAGDNPLGDGHNRFSLRAYGSRRRRQRQRSRSPASPSMAMYADLPSAHTSFYLTQVPPGAAGQILDVRLFDIGDSASPAR